MIIEVPNENSIVKWKNDEKDEWKVAEISDLIKAYERPQGEWVVQPHSMIMKCSLCGNEENAKDVGTINPDKHFCSFCGADMRGGSGMNDNKSLCDTCRYMFTCEHSDVGISLANHTVCYGYAPVKNEEDGKEE